MSCSLRPLAAPLALSALMAGSSAVASPFAGSVAGSFANPVHAGMSLDPVSGTMSAFDNAATAPAFESGFGSDSIAWGDGAPWVVTFAGADYAGVPAGSAFRVGSLAFLNGAISGPSQIFGFELALDDGPGGFLALTTGFAILNTFNTGTEVQNADIVTIGGLALSYHVIEGATGTADLYGLIGEDGRLSLTSILPTNDGGFLVAAPGTAALLAAGLGVLLAPRLHGAAGPPSSRRRACRATRR